MKTLYSIYVVSIAALLTAVFAIMQHDLRQRMAKVSRVVAIRPTRRPMMPFGARPLAR
jgi:hypothetical protein